MPTISFVSSEPYLLVVFRVFGLLLRVCDRDSEHRALECWAPELGFVTHDVYS